MELGTGPFNFHHLRLFLQVVEQGGVTAAAAAAGVSQPAVSAAVRTLERDVGQPLLERAGRGVRPTEAGQMLADYARRIFALEADGRRALDELRGLERGRLAVGASTTVGIYLMPRLLGRFHRRHPAIGLALDIGNTRQIVEQTRRGALDLAVVEGFVADDDLAVEPYLPDELILVAAPGDPLAVDGPVQPRDLAAAPFLVREAGSGTRAVVERAFAGWGVAPTVAMEIGHTEAIKQAVAAGLGVSILSRLAVARELAAGALVHIPIAAEPIMREFLLVRRRAARPSRAAQAFLAVLAVQRPGSRAGHRERRRNSSQPVAGAKSRLRSAENVRPWAWPGTKIAMPWASRNQMASPPSAVQGFATRPREPPPPRHAELVEASRASERQTTRAFDFAAVRNSVSHAGVAPHAA